MQDFTGFRFGQIHSEDLHLIVVSSSNRYTKTLMPTLKDYTTEVPGGDGSYYFGQTFSTQEFTLNIAFDSVSENDWRKISKLFATDKPQDLVFDEQPFKTYRAKLKSKPEFKFVCFIDKSTGERVYKGEGTLNFVCYYPYAFGFNKYVVRAADYYRCLQPSQILTGAASQNLYEEKRKRETILWGTKKFYNVNQNMKTPWKGGYPSLEQVQQGELYFNDPVTNKRTIIDTRSYFDNIPEWEIAAKLLYTPTLDYDRDLIFMPQYSKTNYYNMDLGLARENGVIGSRLLVYNPGDVPIDFELKLTGIFQKLRNFDQHDEDYYRFRISRYNVQRLTIEQAVDWCGLTTHDRDENISYKYGTRYFTILENDGEGNIIKRDLNKSHPEHTYYVEPIPREKLGDFIRSFYWQTMQIQQSWNESDGPLDLGDLCDFWERGKEFANQYEEYRELCISEEEEFELYWDTLDKAILSLYEKHFLLLNEDGTPKIPFLTYKQFKDNYINRGPECLYDVKDNRYYGEYNFNLYTIPEYYTDDYLEINNNDFNKILKHDCDRKDCNRLAEESNSLTIKPLFIDSERRMVYNINEPEVDSNEKFHNFYNFKPSKIIFNDNIERGHWFKIPPGWSLIDITPIIDEDFWNKKRWNEARPFTWGKSSEEFRAIFDKAYEQAARNYLYENYDRINNSSLINEAFGENNIEKIDSDKRKKIKEELTLEKIERLMPFRRWFNDSYYEVTYGEEKANQLEITNRLNTFKNKLLKRELTNIEYGFLKTLNDYWRVSKTDINGLPAGTIDDWYWYANSYIWANFPPAFWAYTDLLNNAQIKYTPLFY